MSEEQAFLQTILEAKDDPLPRLIYADWLEERRDPRAELIRITEERRRLEPASDRAWELRPRLRELERQAPREWLAQLGYDVYRPLFLKVPDERQLRWRLAVEFMESWWGIAVEHIPLQDETFARDEKRLGVRFPAAIREWLTWMGEDNGLNAMSRLSIDPELDVLLLQSASHTTSWGMRRGDLDAEEPPIVLVAREHRQVRPAYARFSDFALKSLIALGIDSSDNLHGCGDCHPSYIEEFQSLTRPCDFPVEPELGAFFEAPGLVAQLTLDDTFLHVGFRPDNAYRRLSQGLLNSLRLLTEEEEEAYFASLDGHASEDEGSAS